MDKHTLDCNNTPCDILVVTSETNGNCPPLPKQMMADKEVIITSAYPYLGVTTGKDLDYMLKKIEAREQELLGKITFLTLRVAQLETLL